MKKIIFSKNYSLLVLLLLILYLVFINLPDNPVSNVMTGGANPNDENPLWGLKADDLNKHLIKHSTIYKILTQYMWVYILIIVILIVLNIYFGSIQYQVQGIPIAGVKPGIRWDTDGIGFINYFYLVAKTKYGLFTPGNRPDIADESLHNFETEFDNFILADNGNARDAIDLFCNVVTPCNLCNCSGPDKNYDGPLTSAPLVPYVGTDPVTNQSCQPKTAAKMKEGLAGNMPTPEEAAQKVADYQEDRGLNDLMFGRIPDCCCHLWQALTDKNINSSNITKIINDVSNQQINIPDHTGCLPHTSITEALTPSGFIPHTDTNGINTEISDNIRSCLQKSSKSGAKDDAITLGLVNPALPTKGLITGKFTLSKLSPHMESCINYNTKIDGGLSPFFLLKNQNKYLTPSVINKNTYSSKGLADVSENWTNPDLSHIKPTDFKKPTNWPTTAPFTINGDGELNNKYYYTNNSGKFYHLKINSSLFEVCAYPVIKVKSSKQPITDPAQKEYLEKFLSDSNIKLNNTNATIPNATKLTTFGQSGWLWFPLN